MEANPAPKLKRRSRRGPPPLPSRLVPGGPSLACLLALIAGCRSLQSGPEPVALPADSRITAIEVTPNRGAVRTTRVITDRTAIRRFVQFVNSRQDQWETPPYTFPSGEYTVAVKQDDEILVVFWPSRGHIGGRQGSEDASHNRLRPLSRDEWSELKNILDITE